MQFINSKKLNFVRASVESIDSTESTYSKEYKDSEFQSKNLKYIKSSNNDSKKIISSNHCGSRRNSGSSSDFTDKESFNDKSSGNISMNKPCSDTTSKCPHYLPN